nr:MAG TPA: hypothetical protein [Caudoviricetes sp.]
MTRIESQRRSRSGRILSRKERCQRAGYYF